MDRGAWQATVHDVAESDRTEQLNTKNNKEMGERSVCASGLVHQFLNRCPLLGAHVSEEIGFYINL